MSEFESMEFSEGDIAVIGMSGRMPGARSLGSFWRNLREGVESISRFSPEELEPMPGLPADPWKHPGFVPAGAVLEGIELFDHDFFDIPLREAQWMDPQQRLFLQCAWAALEDAGHVPERFEGKISLYAGSSLSGHLPRVLGAVSQDPATFFDVSATTTHQNVSSKTSYKLGLTGESVLVYTACSTGLVAIHLACQSLLLRQSDMALAGATKVPVPHRTGYLYQEGMIHSPDGHCRAFDARAQGTVSGSGVGVVVLKRLADAVRDGDHVYAVIKGSAINNDGQLKSGYTAPSVQGQAAVIEQAMAYAGVEPAEIDYVEAHGTGTPLGDPIEVAALMRAFGLGPESQGTCVLGSVKPNIGHLDTAAGVAGLMKVALALHHEEIPPTLHFERPNPQLELERGPFFVNTSLRPWKRNARPRRAGVTSLGIGGTNAHAILEEAPLLPPSKPSSRPQQLVLLSARSASALEAATQELASHVEAHPELKLADVAFTRAVGRKGFEHRRAVVARDGAELVRKLRQPPAAVELKDVAAARLERVAFLFPGQGAQSPGMGRELYEAEPTFRQHVEECLALLQAPLREEVRTLLLLGSASQEAAARLVSNTRCALPALFIVEYSLARLWMSWGVRPHALLGHSYGEYVAACLAGVLPLEDALRLAVARGRMMGQLPPGAMLAVGLSEAQVRPLLSGALSLAGVNAPDRCVVSGPIPEVERLTEELKRREVGVLRLPATHAFHSADVEPLMPELAREVAALRRSAPTLRYVSSLTGTWAVPEQVVQPGYWAEQMRQPVRFASGVEALLREGCGLLLEVGPGQDLTALARACLGSSRGRVRAVPSLRRAGSSTSEHAVLLQSLGEIWSHGPEVDWKAFYSHERRSRLPLPTYPFDEKPCALPESSSADSAVLVPAPRLLAGSAPAVASTPTVAAAPAAHLPASDIEQRVAALWRERLGVAHIGRDDNFLDLGGNSLMAAQLLTQLRETFGVQLPLSDLFEATTIATLSARIEALLGASAAQVARAPGRHLPLAPLPRTGELPLSVVQERVWRLEQTAPGLTAYNLPLALRLEGPLDVPTLERAIQGILQRHESLRTVYARVEGRPVQRFLPHVPASLPVVELTGSREEREAAAPRLASEEARRPFSLEEGPVLRTTLLRLAEDSHVLLVSLHHVVGDTLSLLLFARELAVLYEAFLQGKPSPLPPLYVQYADYGAWQRRALSEGVFAEQHAWWRQRLAGLPRQLDLPTDRPRPAVADLTAAARMQVRFPAHVAEQLAAFSKREGVTSFQVLLAIWQTLLHRYSGQDDIVVGTPIANRSRAELEPLMGYVAHLLALRTDLSGDPSFRELLGRVRDMTLDAYARPDVPFEHLIGELHPGRDLGRERVMDSVFILHSVGGEEALSLSGLRLSSLEVADEQAQWGSTLAVLSIVLNEGPGRLSGVIEYATELFDAARVQRMMAHFQVLLEAAMARPEELLSRLPLATAEERRASALSRLDVLDAPTTLSEVLAARASRQPEVVAVAQGERLLTWSQLRERVRGLSVRLRALGVRPGAPVAVCLEPSPEKLVALWAVLEAGGACVPVGPAELGTLPSFAPAGAPAPLLLTRRGLAVPASLEASRILYMGEEVDGGSTEAPAAATVLSGPDTPAFLLPVAGKPAWTLTHRGLLRLFQAMDERLKPSEARTWVAASEPAAEQPGLELLWALGRGLRVVFPAERLGSRLVHLGSGLRASPVELSLSFFANDEDSLSGPKYELLMEGAKFADAHGFSAVWTPERHFHSFGGLYPQPAVVGAALAAITRRLKIRAGSVVLPLHDPLLVAEQWSVVDNISGGRAGVSLASGWHVHDFVFAPQNYADRKAIMMRELETLRSLWRGEPMRRAGGLGEPVEVALRPRPVQRELPLWITAAGNPETFRLAGEAGVGVLTNLTLHDLKELPEKIALYREAWRRKGHGPGRGHVTVLMHTFIGTDTRQVMETVREPLLSYFRGSLDIIATLLASQGIQAQVDAMSQEDIDTLVAHGFESYARERGLIGTVEEGVERLRQVEAADIDEVACLIDFGVETKGVLEHLRYLAEVLRLNEEESAGQRARLVAQGEGAADELLALVRESGGVYLQTSARLARALVERPEARPVLGAVRGLWLDGASADVAVALHRELEVEVLQTGRVGEDSLMPRAPGELVPVGVRALVLDEAGEPVPVGVVGELALEGAGLPQGSWPHALQPVARLFHTGRRARLRADGGIEPVASAPRRPRSEAPRPTRAPVPALAETLPPPISRVSREGPLPLSFAQQRLWYLHQLAPGNTAYNNPSAFRLTGTLDVGVLQAALDELVNRHEVLRSTFTLSEQGPVQVIHPPRTLPMPLVEVTGETPEAREAELLRLCREETCRPFDLEHGSPFRALLLRLQPEEHVLCLVMHHAVSDGWTSLVLAGEMSALYTAFASGRPSPLSPLPIQYADYAAWQRRWLQGPVLEAQLDWWKEQLAGVPPLELPVDRPRPAVQSHAGAWHFFSLPKALSESLLTLGRREGATPYMTLLALYQLLLHRYSGQEDFAVGSPVAGRTRPETEVLIGCFVNTLALRARLSGSPTFRELLGRVKRDALGAYAHQETPYESVVEALRLPRDLSRSPLCQVMMNLHNTPEVKGALPGMKLGGVEVSPEASKCDLALEAWETREGLRCRFEYATALFEPATVERMAAHLVSLAESVVSAPDARVGELPWLTEAERRQLLVEWNETAVEYPRDTCIHTAFEEQAARRPEAVAVEFGERKLSYRELDERANQLAHVLRAHGVGPDVRVALCLERSVELVVSLLAILKAGGAYLPLDASYPAERLAAMLEDGGSGLLLTSRGLRERLPAGDVPCLLVEELELESQPRRAPESGVGARNLAYVDFTSGSTGRPKGVAIEHRSVLRLLMGVDYARLGPEETFLLIAPISFDASTLEVWGPLLHGGRLVVFPPESPSDVELLGQVLERHGVTTLHLTAGLFTQVVDGRMEILRGVRQLLTGGDVVSAPHVRRVLEELSIPVTACYGPTEGTLFTSCHRMVEVAQVGTAVPIGRPIGNTQVYVLDGAMRPVPVGVVGELYVGGDGLARGYLSRPEQTAERFVPDPFGAVPGERLYRTGDSVRWRADGVLEFLGRRDEQVKVRGFRIELAEVEGALLAQPEVKEAVVVARGEGAGDKRLVAYVVGHGARVDVAGLRGALGTRLPEYMVPSAIVVLEALPLTANGKVDRKALPAPDSARPELAREYVEPRTEVERVLAEVWAQVLGLRRVGARDNFFELGGDSILSLQVVARARKRGLEVTPRQLFQSQTVAELAAGLGEGRGEEEQEVVEGLVPLTPAQRRFFERERKKPWHFNQAVLVEVEQGLEAGVLERALGAVVARHETLRMRYAREGGEWTQRVVGVEEAGRVELEVVDLRAVPEARRVEDLEARAARVQGGLDLEKGPSLRAALFELGGKGRRLLVVIHHLLVDGVSWRVLLEDLERACEQVERGEAVELGPRTASYRKWARRLEEYAKQLETEELAYWEEEGRKEVDALPVDFAGGRNGTELTREVKVVLGREESGALLREAPGAYRARVDEVLLAALVTALGRWGGLKRVRVAMEGHGRQEEVGLDVLGTVGWFTCDYPAVVEVAGEEPGASVRAVKESLRRMPGKGLGYGVLRYLGSEPVKASLGALPRAEVFFGYLGQLEGAAQAGRFTLAKEGRGPLVAEGEARGHLLEVYGEMLEGRLEVAFHYSEGLHRRESLEVLAHYFGQALRKLLEERSRPEARRWTAVDFPLARVGQAQLDRVLGEDLGVGVEDVYPLSPMQQGMLFHTLLEPGSGAYVMQFSWAFPVSVDTLAMRRAWNEVVARNPALRTSFSWAGLAEPLQVVHARAELPWRELDWRGLSPEERKAELEKFLEEDRARGFELSRAPLMRMTLIRQEERVYRLVWSHHHVLLDGWSLGGVVQEAFALYEGFVRGRVPPPASRSPFREYIAWLQRQDVARSEGFWRSTLAGFSAPTPLPADRSGSGAREDEAHRQDDRELELSAPVTAALEGLARRNQLTLNTLVQGAWALLLSRYSGESDVVFGATVSGRPAELPGVEAMVGLFINTLPVRVRMEPGEELVPWLRRLREQGVTLGQYEHCPLVRVQGWSDVPRGMPLFESLLVFENHPMDASLGESARGHEVRDFVGREQLTVPLNLIAYPGERLRLRVSYQRTRFSREAMGRLLEHWRTVLEAMATARPGQRLGELAWVTEAERRRLLVEWNDTRVERPAGPGLHRLVEAQVDRTPDAVAVDCEGARLTYRELDERANRLARHLRTLGVGPEVRVGLCAERSLEMVVGLLGILKAGGAWVPLEPMYPAERLRYMVEDAAAPVLLTQRRLVEKLPEESSLAGARVVFLDTGWEEIARHGAERMESGVVGANLAYVIYTSGSTGRPKGAMNSHEAICNRLLWMQEKYGLGVEGRVLQKTPFGFDVSVWEFFWPLTVGARLVMAKPGGHQDAAYLVRLMAQEGITVAHFVPSMLQVFLEEPGLEKLSSLQRVFSSGEALSAELKERCLGRLRAELYNLYGPTEAAVEVTAWACERGDGRRAVPIGRPVANTRIHILDARLEPVPVGVAGELYIAGVQVGRGYLGRPELTAERFVPDPYGGTPGARMYRTGDLARYQEDGSIEYLGRVDFQVKVRGFRIELGEVEAELEAWPAVREAVVVVREDVPGDKRLVAYVVGQAGQALEVGVLREQLKARLPEYMVPSAFVVLEALPLSPNGKVDRKALPVPGGAQGAREDTYVAPRNELETDLARIFGELLQVEKVGIHDDFFALGGHSLLATQVISRLRDALQVEVPLRKLFESPTVATFALHVIEAQAAMVDMSEFDALMSELEKGDANE
ncbi:amino acid adenylation domain-containing protein [Archangium violaceum]|nr:non-ribosomal peptide synthetase/type I polyketide synthase [Archangium violaceum]QRN99308.1 amino acid adenylation domain-containing protein [Archangium violaceum]